MIDRGGQKLGWRRAIDGWRTFWFKPQPAHTLGLVRMGFGALVLLWTLALLPNLYVLFGRHGVMPQRLSRAFKVSVLDLCSSDRELLLIWVVLLLSSIAMTIGWHTRVASILVFVLVYSFTQGYREMFNAGDGLISIEALVLALSSSGAALSFDQRRDTGSYWSAQYRAPWAIRLLQIQLSLIYVVAFQGKLAGVTWVDGTAVAYAWRRDLDFVLLPAPHWLYDSPLLVNVATWGALVTEAALATLVWNRRCRPWVLMAGVGLHLAIMLMLDVGFYSLAVFVLYLGFVSPDTVRRLPGAFKRVANKWRTIWRRSVDAVTGTKVRLRKSYSDDREPTAPGDETDGSMNRPEVFRDS